MVGWGGLVRSRLMCIYFPFCKMRRTKQLLPSTLVRDIQIYIYVCRGVTQSFHHDAFPYYYNSFPPLQALLYRMGHGGHSHRTFAGRDRPPPQ